MKISISKNKTVEALNKEIQTKFPYLKVEFFKKAHGDFEASPKSDMYNQQTPLGAINEHLDAGDVIFSEDTTVQEVEERFEKDFGLHAQVFRKSGEVWLETVKTDHWSLQKENEKAAEKEI